VEGVIAAIVGAMGGESPRLESVDPQIVAWLFSPWARVLAFALGAALGSFANVLIHRLPEGESIVRPRSRCPACKTPIAAYDNIPILSYLVLRGRCRHCRQPFSARYLVVELLAGVLSFALYFQHVHVPLVAGGGPHVGAWLLWLAFALALLVVVYVDLDWWIIPNSVVLPMAVVGLLAAALIPDVLGVRIVDAAASAVGGYLFFVGMRELWRFLRRMEGLGLGDAKLVLMVGAFTGWRGLFWTVLAGALQGLLVAVPLLLLGRTVANTDLEEVHGDDPELGKEDPGAGVMGRRVPFGPFLALAALELVLLRTQVDAVLDWLLFGRSPRFF
jgi:leader peptidase (prepilin peptidase)/N-methyltransferase